VLLAVRPGNVADGVGVFDPEPLRGLSVLLKSKPVVLVTGNDEVALMDAGGGVTEGWPVPSVDVILTGVDDTGGGGPYP
jgi:hypothetical protein